MAEAEFNINVLGWVPTPGPPDYVDHDHFGEGPKASMRDRIPRLSERLDGALVNLKGKVGEGPKYSCSARMPLPKPDMITPAPTLILPPFGHGGKRSGFPKATPRKVVPTPGPPDYPERPDEFGTSSPSTHVRYGKRTEYGGTISPGPKYIPKWEKTRANSPSYTISPRYKDKKIESPGQFIGQRSTLGGHSYSFSHAFRPNIMH